MLGNKHCWHHLESKEKMESHKTAMNQLNNKSPPLEDLVLYMIQSCSKHNYKPFMTHLDTCQLITSTDSYLKFQSLFTTIMLPSSWWHMMLSITLCSGIPCKLWRGLQLPSLSRVASLGTKRIDINWKSSVLMII